MDQTFVDLKNPFGYVDVNPDPLRNGRGDLVEGADAILIGSLRNLFMCPVGDRGRIFQPTYGTHLHSLLHEPVDEITAQKLHATLLDSVRSWEPRIEVLGGATQVIPNYNLPGYSAILVYRIIGDATNRTATFNVVTNS